MSHVDSGGYAPAAVVATSSPTTSTFVAPAGAAGGEPATSYWSRQSSRASSPSGTRQAATIAADTAMRSGVSRQAPVRTGISTNRYDATTTAASTASRSTASGTGPRSVRSGVRNRITGRCQR